MKQKFFKVFVLIFIITSLSTAQKMIYFEDVAPQIQSPVSITIHPLGDIIIGDNFSNTLFRINPENWHVSQSSTQNYDITLSNPSSISANQLFIIVLDEDNQALFRYDNRLRPISIVSEDQLRLTMEFDRIVYQQLDNRNYLYLLDGVHFNILVLDPSLKFLYSFGGIQDARLEFGEIREFHPYKKNEFLTYDQKKKKFIRFDFTGNKTGSLDFSLDEVQDFCSNQNGILTVYGIRGNDPVMIFQDPSGKQKTLILPELKEQHLIDMAVHPFKSEIYLLFQNGIYIVQSDSLR